MRGKIDLLQASLKEASTPDDTDSVVDDDDVMTSTTVDGTLGAVDPSLELIQMSGLNTPMYRYEEALVRTSDIRYLVTKPCALRSTQEGEPSSSSS